MIMETSNGLGGGRLVRVGYPIITAYALVARVSRADFVAALKKAEGTLGDNWLRNMNEEERAELGVVYNGPPSSHFW